MRDERTLPRAGVGRKLGLRARLLLACAACVGVAAPVMVGLAGRPAALAQRMPAAEALQAQDGFQEEKPMARNATPDFLVATIKPGDPTSTNWGFMMSGRRIRCLNETVESMIEYAYGPHEKQIENAPKWLHEGRYDINGVPDVEGVPNPVQMREMYQKLLTERFHLVFHREMRDLPVYAITVGKGGPKMKAPAPNEWFYTDDLSSNGQWRLKANNISMPQLALQLSMYTDRPVIDETSLKGKYDLSLKWTSDLARADDPGAPPSLFTAMQEQLGLKLEATRGPAEVFVIDHVEKPSAN